jgi:hypothetical protein
VSQNQQDAPVRQQARLGHCNWATTVWHTWFALPLFHHHHLCIPAAGISSLWMALGWNYYTAYAERAEPTISEDITVTQKED